ncbi:MAG: hypothetical protein ACUVTZ_11430 [Armatimonadota bacterium]
MNNRATRSAFSCHPLRVLVFVLILIGVHAGEQAWGGVASVVLADMLGVGMSAADATPERLALVTKAGFRWVRLRVPWAEVEPQRGVYELGPYRNAVRELDRLGLRTVLVLGGGNPAYGPTMCPSSDESRSAFASYCGVVASALKGRARWWEVWEHPNVGDWGGPAADAYVKLVVQAAGRIRQVDRNATISSGALSGVDLTFLREACAVGLLGAVDAIAVEPTRSSPPETVEPDLRQAKQIIKSFSRERSVPLWISGWGYSTKWPGMDERLQAVYAVRMALTCFAEGVPLMVWRTLSDTDGFGLVDNERAVPKPVYQAFSTLAAVSGGTRLRRRMEMPAGLYGVVLEGRSGQVMVVWAQRGRGLLRYQARRAAARALDMLGQAVEVAGGNEHTALQITDAPVYVLGRVSVTAVELVPAGE